MTSISPQDLAKALNKICHDDVGDLREQLQAALSAPNTAIPLVTLHADCESAETPPATASSAGIGNILLAGGAQEQKKMDKVLAELGEIPGLRVRKSSASMKMIEVSGFAHSIVNAINLKSIEAAETAGQDFNIVDGDLGLEAPASTVQENILTPDSRAGQDQSRKSPS